MFASVFTSSSEAQNTFNVYTSFRGVSFEQYFADAQNAYQKDYNSDDQEQLWKKVGFIEFVGERALTLGKQDAVEWAERNLASILEVKNLKSEDWLAVALILEGFAIGNPAMPSDYREQRIAALENIRPEKYLTSRRAMNFYLKLADFYIETDNLEKAEQYYYQAISIAVSLKNLFPEDYFYLLSKYLGVSTTTGRTNYYAPIVKLLYEVEKNGIDITDPKLLSAVSSLSLVTAEVGDFQTSKTLNNLILNHPQKDLEIPVAAKFSALISAAIVDSFSGVRPIKMNWEKHIGAEAFDYAATKIIFNLLEAFSDANGNRVVDIQKLDFSSLEQYNIGSLQLYQPVIELVVASQNNSKSDYKKTLLRLKQTILEQHKRKITFLSYDIKNGLFYSTLKKTLFQTAFQTFGNAPPTEISQLIFEILSFGGSEIDFENKLANVSTEKNFGVTGAMKSLLKINKEIDFITYKLIEKVSNNVIELQKRNYQFVENQEVRESFSFSTTLADQRARYKQLKQINKEAIDSVFSGSLPNTRRIQSALRKKQAIIFFENSENLVFRCLISNTGFNCSMQVQKINFVYEAQALLNEIQQSDKDASFKSSRTATLSKAILQGLNIDDFSEIFFHTNAKNATLPFNLLHYFKDGIEMDERFISESKSIKILPSLVIRELPNNSRKLKSYLGVGNPVFNNAREDGDAFASIFNLRSASYSGQIQSLVNLPDTEDEIRFVSDQLSTSDSTTLIGKEASELNFRLARPNNYKIIHLATHGLVSGEFNGLSTPAIAFSFEEAPSSTLADGLLDSIEVSELELNADLVILSACQTSSDKGLPNAGFTGLVSAFLNSGVREILATQWKIESKSAAKIIGETTADIVSNGVEPVKALFKSVKKHRVENYQHPYYWAPYIIIGSLQQVDPKLDQTQFDVTSHWESRENDSRIEFTGMHKMEESLWATGYKTTFGEKVSRNFVAHLTKEEVKFQFNELGSISIFDSDNARFLYTATERLDGKIVPIIGEFDTKSSKYKTLRRLAITNEYLEMFVDVIKIRDHYFALMQSFSSPEGDDQQLHIVKLSKDFSVLKKAEIKTEIDYESGYRLKAADEKLFLVGSILPIGEQPSFSLSKISYACKTFQMNFYSVDLDDLKTTAKTVKTGFLRNFNAPGKVLIYDRCANQNLVLDLSNFTMEVLSGLAVELSDIDLVVGSENDQEPLYFASGSRRISVLEGFFNKKSEVDFENIFSSKKNIITSNDSYFTALFALTKKLLPKIKLVTESRLISFVNGAALVDGELFFIGSDERDLAFFRSIELGS